MPMLEGRAGGVHYEIDGPPAAPVVLLVNSLGTTTAMWEPQLLTLAGWFRVVRYDHRGHGGSPATAGPYSIEDLAGDALAVMDAVDSERFSVVGLSLGGMVGMWLGSHHPERVERLVLCCTAAKLGVPDDWRARAALVRGGGTEALVETLLGRWFTPAFRAAAPELASSVGAMVAGADPEGYAGCCEAIAEMDQRADLVRVSAPTLVIGGAEDPVVPPALAVELHTSIAGSSLQILADAAHLANLEHPRRFGEVLLDHLSGLAAHRGEAIRRQVLGDAHVDRSLASTNAFTAAFQDFITRAAWGSVWARPGLDLRTRSCITVAVLAALGRPEELELHLRGARRIGLSDAEIAEVLLHVSVYAGAPAANSALALAQRVLGEAGS